MVYNQLTLEKIQQEKKQFAEVALKTTFLPGQKLQSEKFQQLELQKIKEKEIQEMNCRTFLRYLNRDALTNQESGPSGVNTNQSLFGKTKPIAGESQLRTELLNIKSQ